MNKTVIAGSLPRCVVVGVEFCSCQDASDNVAEFTGWSKSIVQWTFPAQLTQNSSYVCWNRCWVSQHYIPRAGQAALSSTIYWKPMS